MIKTKLQYVATIAFFICLIAIEYLATTTLEIKALENSWDKANHLFAFFVLYVLLYYSHFKLTRLNIISLLLVFGVQIEALQYFIPGREFSLLDVVADGVGVLVGVLFVTFVLNRKKLRTF